MGGPRVRALARTFVAHVSNAVCLFSHGSSQSENGAYPSPFNPPPVPLIDQGLQHECYSETVRQLRALFPPTCTLLEPEDVRVVGDTPIGAGGFADIWGGIIDGHSVLQKSYRCYEHCCDERIFRVRKNRSSSFTYPMVNTPFPEIPRGGMGAHPTFSSEHRPVYWDQPHPKSSLFSRPRRRWSPRSQRIPLQEPRSQ